MLATSCAFELGDMLTTDAGRGPAAASTTDTGTGAAGAGGAGGSGGCGLRRAPSVLARGESMPTSIAVDDVAIYWTTTGNIRTLPKQMIDAAPTTLVPGQTGARGIALDRNRIYWVNYQGGEVRVADKAAKVEQVLQQGQMLPTAVIVDQTSIYWLNTGANASLRKAAKTQGAAFSELSDGGGFELAQ